MIKYTILYKNGKTWNGKAESLESIPVPNDAVLMMFRDLECYVCRPSDDGSWFDVLFIPELSKSKPTRTPNPSSVTKKQKKFDEDYAEWKINNSNLVDYDDGGGYMKYAHVGNGDTSIKAYKKWLWEQKQAELKSVDVATSITFSEPVEVPVNITINWDGIYKPWKEAAIKKYKTHSYNEPIKTTYTFWLGQDGSISDE